MIQNLLVLALVVLLQVHPATATPPAASMEAAADYSRSHRGQTMIVMFDGDVVFERYANGGLAGRAQMLASGSKSFVGIAAVAAVQDGIIKLDDRVCESLTEWSGHPQKSNITYRQLLTLTSGLAPSEHPVRAPSWQEIIDKPMSAKPGERFGYGANQLNAFAYALQRKLKNESFEAYLKRRVLDAIGVSVTWRFRCSDGHPQVGGGAFMTARDWATFGEFVRREGNWNGLQVISRRLLAECFQGTEQNPTYGLTWWLKKPITRELRRKIPVLSADWGDVANSDSLPADLVAACGAGKQRLYVIPSLKMVVVRQGALARGFSDVEFLNLLLRPKPAGD